MAQTDSAQPRARITYFDWLRGAATLAVVVLHMFNKMLTDYTVDELGVPLVVTWTELQLVFTRWAVPCFLMITGALLLNPQRQITWKKVGQYVLRMVAVLLIFCPAYTCMSARAITLAAIAEGLHKAFIQDSWDHLWYVYALIGLYLLTPLLSAYVRSASREDQRMTLLVLGVFTLCVPTFNSATGWGAVTFVWVSHALFYYLLGSYAHRYLRLDARFRTLGLGAMALAAISIIGIVCTQGRYPKWLIHPKCPLIALWSLYLFLAAKSHLDGKPVPKLLELASSHSLAIYLIHPLVLIVLYRRLWWMPFETLPPVVFELVVLAIVFGVTIPAAVVLKRIPGLRNIL